MNVTIIPIIITDYIMIILYDSSKCNDDGHYDDDELSKMVIFQFSSQPVNVYHFAYTLLIRPLPQLGD